MEQQHASWLVTNGWAFALYQSIKHWNRERIRRRRLWKLVQELADKLDDQTAKLQELGVKVERGFAHQDGRMDAIQQDFTQQFQHQKEVIHQSQVALTSELAKAKVDINQNTADVFSTYLVRLEETEALLKDMHLKLDNQGRSMESNFASSHASMEDLSRKLNHIIQFIEPYRTTSSSSSSSTTSSLPSSSTVKPAVAQQWELATAN